MHTRQTFFTASRCPVVVKQQVPCVPTIRPCGQLQRSRSAHFRCRSSTSEPQQADATQKADTGDTKIKQTLADLDALLGIQEEEKKDKAKQEEDKV